MSNKYFKVNEKGVFTVDTSSIKTALEDAYKNALGQTLNVNAGVQKQLIINDTETITQFMKDICLVLNGTNIFYATDEALDITASRFGYYRKLDTKTVVSATVSGSVNTVIPVGSIVSDGTNQFKLLSGVIIPESGSIETEFQAIKSGSIPCVANSLTTIISVIPGWDSVNNSNAGIEGYDRESDNTFRSRVLDTLLQMRAKVLLGSIAANIGQVKDVLSSKVLENPTNEEATIEGVVLPAYSIYACVLGGLGSDIAEVLAKTKTLGCPMSGNTIITYYDSVSGYNNNYKIDRPTIVPINVQITYSASNAPSNIGSVLSSTLLAYIKSNPIQIGQTVSSFYLNQAFYNFTLSQILSVKVKLSTETDYSDYADANGNQILQLTSDNITFVGV